MKPDEFIAAIAPSAQSAAKETGVLASVSIAQAALESGWGVHAPAFNLFGIKADKSWPGPVSYQVTTEVVRGHRQTITAAFRSYPNWSASIADHAKFLKENPRYMPCFSCTTAEGFATMLQRCGYSTDPNYAASLSALIRQHKLTQFDV